MKNINIVIAGGLLTGALFFPALPASADHKDEKENHGWHKGWENKHHGSAKGHDKKWHDCDHHDHGIDHRVRDRHGDHYYRRDFPHHPVTDRRGMEIRKDVRDVCAARKEVAQDRLQLQKNVTELRKDQAELRKDIRTGASRKEIARDRREIRDDKQKIAESRQEVRQSHSQLDAARQELRDDLRSW